MPEQAWRSCFIEFPNPWYNPRRSGSRRTYSVGRVAEHVAGGFSFYNTPGNVSVIAVNEEGQVVTECVTIEGAKRRLGIR